ncbi:sensor histidine kinase [Leeuwenhoekiella polynyae]|uniref:histidine kinase n=1 Tax=Leeuwenhoekiella polynyae TaxID=1550906 RepID=A0A4V1KQK6_9FLAO|nr:HAMP domain-containing sensor histidine kinase [Leeuwenhoekiella polynyae]RXG21742.1 hypothetical protein DSM02_1987 [Leeuwenhoekiella polynyae]
MADQKKIHLLQKASKTFLITSSIIMIFSGVALYLSLKSLLENEIEEELFSNKDRVEHLLISKPDLQGIPPIMVVEKVKDPQPAVLNDTLIYDPLQDEIELFRELSGTKEINGQEYKITVRAMVIESENILFAIVFTFLAIILVAFVFLFYLNKSRNAALWNPFFKNLAKIKAFSIKSETPLTLTESDIIEFDDLNREVILLTTKVHADYQNLKQFTEDVSHEMQTPLAIMQAKIETLFNGVKINDFQYEQLDSLQNDIRRLKNLNKRLIILAKIDNNQFADPQFVSINELFQEVLLNFKELASIDFKIEHNEELTVKMDRSLAQVLANNLISNAVKHNLENHPIKVNFFKNSVQIVNSGNSELAHPEQVFDRFYKESTKRDSSGLGLSIVKKICDYYGFTPSYSFTKSPETTTGFHTFKIRFTH